MQHRDQPDWDRLEKEVLSEIAGENVLPPTAFHIRGGEGGYERGYYCVELKVGGRIGFAEMISWREVYRLLNRHLPEIESFEAFIGPQNF